MPFNAKQLLRAAIESAADGATVEDVVRRFYLLAKTARALETADRGELIPHADIEREFQLKE